MRQHGFDDRGTFGAACRKRRDDDALRERMSGFGFMHAVHRRDAESIGVLFRALLCGGLLVVMSGCGGEGSTSAPGTGVVAPKTIAEKIADAESAGSLPKLDRSASLAGQDTDSNGVRDDVEAYLSSQISSPEQLKSALQTARVVQTMVLADPTDKVKADAIDLASMRGIHCMSEKFPADTAHNSLAMVSLLEKITANTKARAIAYLTYSDSRDGTVSSVPRESTCD